MLKLMGRSVLRKFTISVHCKLRQLSEMVQSPVVPSMDKVWVLRLVRESHIWDRVTLGAQVGDSDVGEGVGVGVVVGEGGETAVEAKKHKHSQFNQTNV